MRTEDSHRAPSAGGAGATNNGYDAMRIVSGVRFDKRLHRAVLVRPTYQNAIVCVCVCARALRSPAR